jgi:hypothetical protein
VSSAVSPSDGRSIPVGLSRHLSREETHGTIFFLQIPYLL